MSSRIAARDSGPSGATGGSWAAIDPGSIGGRTAYDSMPYPGGDPGAVRVLTVDIADPAEPRVVAKDVYSGTLTAGVFVTTLRNDALSMPAPNPHFEPTWMARIWGE